jgi:hypothetical protein
MWRSRRNWWYATRPDGATGVGTGCSGGVRGSWRSRVLERVCGPPRYRAPPAWPLRSQLPRPQRPVARLAAGRGRRPPPTVTPVTPAPPVTHESLSRVLVSHERASGGTRHRAAPQPSLLSHRRPGRPANCGTICDIGHPSGVFDIGHPSRAAERPPDAASEQGITSVPRRCRRSRPPLADGGSEDVGRAPLPHSSDRALSGMREPAAARPCRAPLGHHSGSPRHSACCDGSRNPPCRAGDSVVRFSGPWMRHGRRACRAAAPPSPTTRPGAVLDWLAAVQRRWSVPSVPANWCRWTSPQTAKEAAFLLSAGQRPLIRG